jgi:hypothetical protein
MKPEINALAPPYRDPTYRDPTYRDPIDREIRHEYA